MIATSNDKTYHECINEISKDVLLEGLVGHGLFTEKLPPIFTSEQFYQHCKTNGFTYPNSRCLSWIHWECTRNTNRPRAFGIPTPMTYSNLCVCLAENWDYILKHFEKVTKKADHKVSRIHVRKLKGSKALFKMNYTNWKTDSSPEADLLIGKKYLVTADVSNCFPSIYTHAISWALVTRDYAKVNRGSTLWFNQIDEKTRNCKHGETHGILIGPHASNLLSEIVLTAIDSKLSKKWSYIRNIDDYKCYVSSHEDAQNFLKDLRAELREYDLSLNHKKTSVTTLPVGATQQWHRKMNINNVFRKNEIIQYPAARAYLDTAIELASQNEDDAVLSYALKSLSSQPLSNNAKLYCAKTFLHLSLIKPYLISYLEEYVFEALELSSDRISSFTQQLYSQACAERETESLSYALYFAKKYEVTLIDHNISVSLASKDCILLLIEYLYCEHVGDKKSCREIKKIATEILKKGDMDSYWLLVYEILPMSSLRGDWEKLKRSGVSFVRT